MENEGIYFDIQRSAMHDGPGIRTVLFLKGCPLHCAWCHNPESQSIRPELGYFAAKCIRCGRCAAVCPAGSHLLAEGGHQYLRESCSHCGRCASACPTVALRLYGRKATVDELMPVILADRDYYAHSGGGLTVSGGEPFFQFPFLKELLAKARAEGIHTAVETCGHAASSLYLEALPVTDLFLFDIKVSTEELQKAYVGGSLALILRNLQLLYENGAEIQLRCPIIPGVNDTEAHFLFLRDLTRRYPRLQGPEFLPYHNYGQAKEKALGRAVGFESETITLDQLKYPEVFFPSSRF